jgi:hypothetical protein
MNQIKKFLLGLDLKSILIVGLILALLLTKTCSSGQQSTSPTIKVDGKTYEVLKHTIDTVTIVKTKTVYKDGRTIWRDKPIYVELPTKIDTTEVLNDYYAKYTFKDTLRLDDNLGTVNVTDTISQNKIVARTWNCKINQKIIYDVTIVKELPKVQLYVGGTAGFDKVNVVNFIGPSVLLKTKQDHIYSLGVGYGINKAVCVQGGIYWKIRLKK